MSCVVSKLFSNEKIKADTYLKKITLYETKISTLDSKENKSKSDYAQISLYQEKLLKCKLMHQVDILKSQKKSEIDKSKLKEALELKNIYKIKIIENFETRLQQIEESFEKIPADNQERLLNKVIGMKEELAEHKQEVLSKLNEIEKFLQLLQKENQSDDK